MSNIIYKIEQHESDTIRELFEKKLAFENLAKIISPEANPIMYERLVSDYGKTVRLFNNWWDDIFKKYHCAPGNYSIDFDSNYIINTDNS